MTTGMIGRKLGMMRVFDGSGRVRGVTVMDNGRIVGAGGHGKYLWRRIGQPPITGKTA